MIAPRPRLGLAGLALMLAATLVGCAPQPGTDASPTPSAPPSPSHSPSASVPGDEARFLIECVADDGSVVDTFTRLEEAWASTNYLRIDHCSASPATGEPIELTPEEQAIAQTAAADIPDKDAVELYLWTLATCVRVAPTSAEGLSTLPASLLEATLQLCPEAPHAGLIEDELEARGQG